MYSQYRYPVFHTTVVVAVDCIDKQKAHTCTYIILFAASVFSTVGALSSKNCLLLGIIKIPTLLVVLASYYYYLLGTRYSVHYWYW